MLSNYKHWFMNCQPFMLQNNKNETANRPALSRAHLTEIHTRIGTAGADLDRQTRRRLHAFDEKIRSWQQRVVRQKTIHCRKGCRFCCDAMNWATLTEALVLSPLLTRHERALFHRMDTDLCRLARQTSAEDLFEAYRSRIGICPLYCRDSLCRLHSRRPLSCRSVFSFFPPFLCRADVLSRHGSRRIFPLIQDHPSPLYQDTPYAIDPLAWRERYHNDLARLMLDRIGCSVEGALPALITLVDRLSCMTSGKSRQSEDILLWLNDRVRFDLISMTARSAS